MIILLYDLLYDFYRYYIFTSRESIHPLLEQINIILNSCKFANGVTGVWFEVSHFNDQIINLSESWVPEYRTG